MSAERWRRHARNEQKLLHKADTAMITPKCLFLAQVPVASASTCPRHQHACTEIVLSRQSNGWLYDRGQRFRYGDGTFFAYQPGSEHWIENEVEGVHWCLGLAGSGADRLPVGDLPACPAAVRRVDDMILELNRQGAHHADRLDLLSGLLVLDLLESLDSASATDAAPPSLAHAARNLLDARFAEPLTISDVADSLYISPEHLRRMFRETFGTSPMHYLIRRRIEHAQELLRITHLPLHEIARQCGIDNPYYFSRLFRKVVGQTASQYRRANCSQ